MSQECQEAAGFSPLSTVHKFTPCCDLCQGWSIVLINSLYQTFAVQELFKSLPYLYRKYSTFQLTSNQVKTSQLYPIIAWSLSAHVPAPIPDRAGRGRDLHRSLSGLQPPRLQGSWVREDSTLCFPPSQPATWLWTKERTLRFGLGTSLYLRCQAWVLTDRGVSKAILKLRRRQQNWFITGW